MGARTPEDQKAGAQGRTGSPCGLPCPDDGCFLFLLEHSIDQRANLVSTLPGSSQVRQELGVETCGQPRGARRMGPADAPGPGTLDGRVGPALTAGGGPARSRLQDSMVLNSVLTSPAHLLSSTISDSWIIPFSSEHVGWPVTPHPIHHLAQKANQRKLK